MKTARTAPHFHLRRAYAAVLAALCQAPLWAAPDPGALPEGGRSAPAARRSASRAAAWTSTRPASAR
ncbi:hypothetical protein [Chitinimonas koreensis]|uniref:hypothetical protein n=1 Tax=Chitinimonas koreensis TaxID=356302 RepID=UPI0016545D7E|nr:hypothetical protein [Chitinimonas koreensis]QNM98589.1 hypothetical protein H9L41_10400 [Chitinimonas koreensis]